MCACGAGRQWLSGGGAGLSGAATLARLSSLLYFTLLYVLYSRIKVAVCLYPLETVVFAVCVTDVTTMTSKLQYV